MSWPEVAAVLGTAVMVFEYLHSRAETDLEARVERLERQVRALRCPAGSERNQADCGAE